VENCPASGQVLLIASVVSIFNLDRTGTNKAGVGAAPPRLQSKANVQLVVLLHSGSGSSYDAREIPRPAGENAGLRDDASRGRCRIQQTAPLPNLLARGILSHYSCKVVPREIHGSSLEASS